MAYLKQLQRQLKIHLKDFKAARSQEELLMEQQKENLEVEDLDMFKSLIEGQVRYISRKRKLVIHQVLNYKKLK